MQSEDEIKKKVKDVFYEKGKPPSNKNYLVLLAVIAIIAVAAYFTILQPGATPETWEKEPQIESTSDVNKAVSDLGNMLSNTTDVLDDIDRTI